MDRKEFNKILDGGICFGLIALGVYNVYWFVYYFMHGRDISVLPSKTRLFLADIDVFATTVIVVIILEFISRRLRRNKQTDNDEIENK